MTETGDLKEENRSFWNARADMGFAAGTNDVNLKKLLGNSNEASPVAVAELRLYEANKLEQLPAGGHCVLQVMKLRQLSVIAPN